MAGKGFRAKLGATVAGSTTPASNAVLHAAAVTRATLAAHAPVAHPPAAHLTLDARPGESPAAKWQRIAAEHAARPVAPTPAPAAKAATGPKLTKDHKEALSLVKENGTVTVTPAAEGRMALFRDLAAGGHVVASAPNARGHVEFSMPGKAPAVTAKPKVGDVEATAKGTPGVRVRREDVTAARGLSKLAKGDLELVARVSSIMAGRNWGAAGNMSPHELARAETVMTQLGML